MNPIRTIKYQLYLFQLENYNIKRYWNLVLKRPFITGELRKNIVWTPKATLLLATALSLQLFLSFWLSFDKFLLWIVIFVVLFYFHFIFLITAKILIEPIDRIVKRQIIKKAKAKIATLQNLKIIGITGSYGKTTMKNVLQTVLSEKYEVFITELKQAQVG